MNVPRIGFTQGELDRAKSEFMASIEKAYNDRTKTNSENFVGEFQANFLENEPARIEWTFKTFKQILPLIELKDVNG
jgi:zinc protease